MSPSLQLQSSDLSQAYEQCVKEGKLTGDDAQRQVIAHLQKLSAEATKYERPTLLNRLRGEIGTLIPLIRQKPPRSVYIWGDVGRGKSLLMNMFHLTQRGSRIHFQAFMEHVHAIAHGWRKAEQEKTLPGFARRKGVLAWAALQIFTECSWLICLDELEVTDVADAMILSKLFKELFKLGCVFVITSNKPPEDLYAGGLQRQSFLEFVDLIYERADVLHLASPNDYRMQQMKAMRTVYRYPLTQEAEVAMSETLGDLTHRAKLQAVMLDISGRKLQVAKSYGGFARFHFSDLCEKPLGSHDYLAIARRFHTVFISSIPILTPEKRNEARRFIMLIDALYDHRVKLICTAAALPAELYIQGDGTFEFARTVSRLAEMQSAQYLASAHIP